MPKDKHELFKPVERAAIRGMLIAVKRFFNAPADSREEIEMAEALITLVENMEGLG